jgi:hypothetical protein
VDAIVLGFSGDFVVAAKQEVGQQRYANQCNAGNYLLQARTALLWM